MKANETNTPTVSTVAALETIANAAQVAGNFLRILGRSGAGKTTIAAGLAPALGIDADQIGRAHV